MRILVIRTSALGDTILATPALRALRSRFPDAEIHFVTNDGLAPVFDGLPDVTRVWPWKMGGGMKTARGLPRFAAALHATGRFDLVVDLQNSVATRLLTLRLRPRRVLRFVKRRGFVAVASSLVGEGPILDDLPAAALFIGALAPLGIAIPDVGAAELKPSIHLEADSHEAAARLLAEAGESPIVALAPGARWAVKRWDPKRFAAVGNALAAAGARIVLVGGPADRRELEATREALAVPPVADTADQGIPVLAAVIARASVLVTCDSAPSHIAQAVGTPVVTIFGPTSARRWGPLPDLGVAVGLPLACSPCTNFGKRPCPLGHHACMADLQARPVLDAALAALNAGRTQGARAAADAGAREKVALAMDAARSRREVRR